LRTLLAPIFVAVCALVAPGCSVRAGEPEAATISPSAAADYAVFAQRCSKCHSLARPLNSGIDRDDYWRLYVAKMRRQPGSGISVEDSVAILRYLHLYSIEQRRKKEQSIELEPALASPDPPDASPPTGTP
jgi:hypothetical protein